MGQSSLVRSRLGLVWSTDDPVGAATRLSEALDGEIVPLVACSIGGLALTVSTSPEADRFDRLRVVTPGEAPGIDVMAVVAVAWATVDSDRAEGELVECGVVFGPFLADAPVPVLGAEARRVGETAFGVPLLLLEPATEGRLAATLARHGEGPCALVVGEAHSGPPTLAPGGAPSGPHLLVHGGGYHRGR